MSEKPIRFYAPEVRALLAGTKTQTRRVVKPQPEWTEPDTAWQYGDGHSGLCWYAYSDEYPEEGALNYRCPYGQPGDRLWVRETWGDMALPGYSPVYAYRADPESGEGWAVPPGFRWRPSIHMPRRASRITLEITGVRVERLQDISADDAKDEGISEFIGGWWCEHDDAEQIAGMTPQEGYRHLWERINGPGSWDANPWVWVVEFKRVEVPIRQASEQANA